MKLTLQMAIQNLPLVACPCLVVGLVDVALVGGVEYPGGLGLERKSELVRLVSS